MSRARTALLFAAVLAGLAACGTVTPVPVTPSVSLSPAPSASPSPSSSPSPSPTFTWESRPATADDALTWRAECPVGIEDLVVVTVSHWTFEGEVDTGELVINAAIDNQSRQAFSALFDQGFPIYSIRNIDEFDGSDDASMAADNTSGFNCRYAVADGAPQWSNHAYGRAIDVNPVENPYVYHGRALPPQGSAYVDRTMESPGMLVEGGAALQAFLDAGFFWGGVWNSSDYQHLEIEE